MSEVNGIISHITTEVAAFNKEAEGLFLAALEPGTYPMRDIAVANGLLRPDIDAGKKLIQWFEGATGATSANLRVAISADSTTTFDFGTTVIKGIVPNQIIAFKDELVQVTSVDYTAGTCVVVRGFASTTPEASILTTDTGKVISTTPGSTEDAGGARASFSDTYSNYLHLWEQACLFDDVTQGTLGSYKTPDVDVKYQLMDKVAVIGREMGNAIWDSRATAAGAVNRTMNGFRAQVPTASISPNVGALYFSSLDTPVAASHALGGALDLMIVHPDLKVQLAAWNGRRGGGVVISELTSAGGSLETFRTASGQILQVKADSTMRPQEIFLCREQDLHAGLVPILNAPVNAPDVALPQGIRAELMGKTGMFHKVQVAAYGSCQLTRPGLSRLLTGVSSVDADGLA